MDCIDEGDKDGVRALLCSALKNNENIDKNIEELVDGFEGDNISVTEYGQNTMKSGSYGNDYASAFLSLTIGCPCIFGVSRFHYINFSSVVHKHLPTIVLRLSCFCHFTKKTKKAALSLLKTVKSLKR